MSRLFVPAFVFVVMLAGCGGGGNDAGAAGADSTGYRKALIGGLELLRSRTATANKDSMALLFNFPIPDSVVSIYTTDSTADKELKAGRHGITRRMYDSAFGEFSRGWNLGEFNRVFTVLDLQKLVYTNRVEHHDAAGGDPCVKFYSIDFGIDSIVSISYGASPAKGSGKAGATCGPAIVWQFRFDGERLWLVRQTAAG